MIVEFDEEEEIAENDSKTFYVLATVTGAETDDKDSFSFNLINTADSNGINDNLTGSITNLEVEGAKLYDLSVITSYSVDFLWSDKARGLNHSETYDDTAYEDWSNGYLLNTFPINNTID